MMNGKLCCLALAVFLGVASFRANAADKVTLKIKDQAISLWRTVDLESAKREAVANALEQIKGKF